MLMPKWLQNAVSNYIEFERELNQLNAIVPDRSFADLKRVSNNLAKRCERLPNNIRANDIARRLRILTQEGYDMDLAQLKVMCEIDEIEAQLQRAMTRGL